MSGPGWPPRRLRWIAVMAVVAAVAAALAIPVMVSLSEEAPPTLPLPDPPTASEYVPPTSSVSPEDALIGRASSDDLTRFAAAAPTVVAAESTGVVARNSPRAEQLPGVRRPCARARGFTVYATKDLAGLPLKQVTSTCETPPGVEDGRLLRPGRTNETVAQYGRCVGRDTAPPCARRLSVTSAPSCERPHALYHALAGPGGRHVASHEHLTLRGVPAIRFDGGRAITLYTRWTTLTIRSDSVRRTAEAARTAMPAPASFGRSEASYARLPAPSAAVAANRLGTVPCAE